MVNLKEKMWLCLSDSWVRRSPIGDGHFRGAQDRKPETTTSQKAPLLTSKTRSLENSGWRIGSLTPGWGDGVGDVWGRRWC